MGARGEGTIQAGDQEIGVFFDNRALSAVTKELDRPIFQIIGVQIADIGNLSVNSSEVVNHLRPDYLTVLLREGMESFRRQSRSASKPVTLAQADAVMNKIGLLGAFSFLLPLVMDVLQGTSRDQDQTGAAVQDGDAPNA